MSQDTPLNSSNASGSRFSTTHWSVVLAAGAFGSADSRQALERLCKTYWYPLYTYLRRRGCDTHQAEDYTQAFFAVLYSFSISCLRKGRISLSTISYLNSPL